MEVVNLLPEELLHGCLGIGTRSALVHDPRLLINQRVHRDERQTVKLSRIIHHAVLALAADRHDLFVKLPDRPAVELRSRHPGQRRQLLLLPLLVQNPFAGFDFILRNLLRNRHPLFEELHNLCVDFIQLLSVFLKSHGYLSVL